MMILERFLLKHNIPARFLGLFRNTFVGNKEKTESLFQFSNDGDLIGFRAPVIDAFEKRLGLSFETGSRNNVCFANHEEVTPEFRTSFTAGELLEYILSFITEAEAGVGTSDNFLLPIPSDGYFFWEQVEKGKRVKLHYK